MTTMLQAWCKRQTELALLRCEAEHLCINLCSRLQWKHTPERTTRLEHALARARARNERRRQTERG